VENFWAGPSKVKIPTLIWGKPRLNSKKEAQAPHRAIQGFIVRGGVRFSPTAAFREAFAPCVFRQIPSRPIACQRPPTANERRVVGSAGGVRT
jgi:hypothetical protein